MKKPMNFKVFDTDSGHYISHTFIGENGKVYVFDEMTGDLTKDNTDNYIIEWEDCSVNTGEK